MFKIMKNAWSIPDLRRKLLFTLLIIIVFRIGSVIPVPFLDSNVLAPGCKLKLKLYVVYWKSVASLNSPWLRVIVPLITPPSK